MGFYGNYFNEVSVNSKLDKEFNSKEHLELDSFKSVRITKTQIDKYKELKHCKSENCEGFIWLDGDKVICYVNVETKDNDEKWIQALEVMKDYQGKGIANQLLYVATSNLGARYLSVNKKNEIAIKLYKDYGFKIYDETDIMYFMKLGR